MKILAIGLDGATLRLIEPWAREGNLPVLRRLLDEGAGGPLWSTIPPLTPPAWTTSVTGKNPGAHNIFDFLVPGQFTLPKSAYRPPLVSSAQRRAKTVWEHLNDYGFTAGVVSLPVTFPPTPVKDYMVAEPPGYVEDEFATFPSSLRNELLRVAPSRYWDNPFEGFAAQDYEGLRERLRSNLEARGRLARHLLRHHPTDFTLIVFPELDIAQHFFWHFMDGAHPWHPGETPLANTLLELYQLADGIIRELLNVVGKGTNILVYSDHGFGPIAHDVMVNVWLMERGYLRLKGSGAASSPRVNRVVLGRLARAWRLRWLTRRIPERLKSLVPSLPNDNDLIDWRHTRAYFYSQVGQSIMLNLRGREPRGIVPPGPEYARVREEIAEQLLHLAHPETGQRAIQAVYRREEVYHGPFVENAPDLIILPTPGFHLKLGFHGPLIQTRQDPVPRSGSHAPERMSLWGVPLQLPKFPPMSGNHEPEGMFLWHGPDIQPGVRLTARIEDIAPTVLYGYGVPLPFMDGRVVREVFRSHAPPSDGENNKGHPYSPEQERKVVARLKALGYTE